MTAGFSGVRTRAWVEHAGLRVISEPWRLFVLGIIFTVLLVSRRPGVIFHANLWAEDGIVWYPEAYKFGFVSLTISQNGYLQTISRIVALIAQPMPLAWAPTIFAAAALLVQVTVALFLCSTRLATAWPCGWARVAFALIYVGLPGASEVYGNLTNAQWHLVLLAFLILVSNTPATRLATAFDLVVLAISGLSGPVCLLLLPVAAWQAMERREAVVTTRTLVVLASAVVQGSLMALHFHDERSLAPLGASPEWLARVIAGPIFLAAELSYDGANRVLSWHSWNSNLLPLLLSELAALLGLLALWHGSSSLRKFCAFAALVLAATLVSPQASLDQPQWPILAAAIGCRYFLIPILAWVGILFSLSVDPHIWVRAAARGLLVLLVAWAIPQEWSYHAWPRTDFVIRAQQWETAAPGVRMEFPIFPSGWPPMTLVKR